MNRLQSTTAALVASLLSFATVAQVGAQGVSVLAPVLPSYTIGQFTYEPPTADGWRQLTHDSETFRLVYAEDLGEGRINTRVEIVAQAFAIPDSALVTDAVTLAQTSQNQQAAERGERLIAFSRVVQLADAMNVHSFTLVSKAGETDLQEIFFVSLAPDKSEYFIAKLSTTEGNYVESPFYSPFLASLSSLSHAADEAADATDDDETEPSGDAAPGGSAE